MRIYYYQPIFRYTFKYACSEDIYTHESTIIFRTKERAMSWAKETWKDIKDDDDILIDITYKILFIG